MGTNISIKTGYTSYQFKRQLFHTANKPTLFIAIVLLTFLLFTSFKCFAAEANYLSEIKTALEDYIESVRSDFDPELLQKTKPGLMARKEWAPPLVKKNGIPDYKALGEIYGKIISGQAGSKQKEYLYQLYKTLPYIQDLHTSSYSREVFDPVSEMAPPHAGELGETAMKMGEGAFEVLEVYAGVENPYKLARTDPLTVKNNIIKVLQQTDLIPDYEKSFKESNRLLELANKQLQQLDGSEPPQVAEYLKGVSKIVRQNAELMALQYVGTTYNRGKLPTSREAYQKLQESINEGTSELLAMLAKAPAYGGSPAESAAFSRNVDKKIGEIKKEVLKNSKRFLRSKIQEEDYSYEYSGLQALIGSPEPIHGSTEASREMPGILDGYAKKLVTLEDKFLKESEKYDQKRKVSLENLEAKIRGMSLAEKKDFLKNTMHAGHSAMHEGDYLQAARYYGTAQKVKESLGVIERSKRLLGGHADPIDYISKAFDACSNPDEYDRHYVGIEVSKMTKQERAATYQEAIVAAYSEKNSGNIDKALDYLEYAKIIYEKMTPVERIDIRHHWGPPDRYITEISKIHPASASSEQLRPKRRVRTASKKLARVSHKPKVDVSRSDRALVEEARKRFKNKADDIIARYEEILIRHPNHPQYSTIQNAINSLKRARDQAMHTDYSQILDRMFGYEHQRLDQAKVNLGSKSKSERLKALDDLYLCATSNLAKQDKDSVIRLLKQAAKSDGDAAIRRRAGNLLAKISKINQFQNNERFRKAKSALNNGTSSKKEIALIKNPKTVRQYRNLAEAYRKNGDFERASEWERRANRLDSNKKATKRLPESKKNIGGVELNYAKDFVSNGIRDARVEAERAMITLTTATGRKYRIDELVRKEIMDALFYIYNKTGDISKLAFTINTEKPELEKTNEYLQDWVKKNWKRLKARGNGIYPVSHIKIKKVPIYLGFEYGDTIVGKIVLEADIALKYLTMGVHPVTFEPYIISEEFQKAVDQAGSSFCRVWLYLKSARIEDKAEELNIDIKVGVKCKSIKHVNDYQTIDIGEGPKELQTIVRILEENYDKIAEEIPSWQMLKEVYKGIAIVQLLDTMSAIPQIELNDADITKYHRPKYIEETTLYTLSDDGLLVAPCGGVNMNLLNKYNKEQTSSNNYWSQLYKLAALSSDDPYLRIVAKFLKWDIDSVIAESSTMLRDNPNDWKLLNLRGIAYACKSLDLPKPAKLFNPAIFSTIVGEKYVDQAKSDADWAMKVDFNGLKKSVGDFQAAADIDTYVPYLNLSLVKKIMEIPGRFWEEKALTTKNEVEKLKLHRKAADLYMQTGNWAKAAKRLEYLCDKNPTDFDIYYQQVKAYIEDAKTNIIGEEIPRVLFLPLRNVTKNPNDNWLSRGLGHLLHYAAHIHQGMLVIDPSIIRKAEKTFHLSDRKLYEQGFATNTLANLNEIRATHIVTGTFIKFGKMIKVNLNILNKATGKKSSLEIKGKLEEAHRLIKDLHDGLLFEVAEKVTKDVTYDDLPRAPEDLIVWCRVREVVAKTDDSEIDSYLRNKMSEGNSEAILSRAEILIHQNKFKDAVDMLKKASINGDSLWRRQYLLGVATYAMGDMVNARMYLNKASRLNPRTELPLLILREIQPDNIAKYFVDSMLIEKRTSYAPSYLESALFLNAIGDNMNALKCLKKLLMRNREIDREALEAAEEIWAQIGEQKRGAEIGTNSMG